MQILRNRLLLGVALLLAAAPVAATQVTLLTTATTNQTLVGTASGVLGLATLPNCADITGNHLNYNNTTQTFSCGNTGGSASALFGTISNTNPLVSGDVTTGLYSASAGHVDVGIAGVNLIDWSNAGQSVAAATATALTVGANGATNPVLTIDASTASVVTGVAIKGAATAGTSTITATDSGANAGLTIQSKGTGKMTVNSPSSGNLELQTSGVARQTIGLGGSTFAFSPASYASAATSKFLITGVADTGITASTESHFVYANIGAATRQHATGALTTQRDFRISGATDSFVAASTLTDGATLGLGYKSCGTNGTCTNESALYVPTAAITGTVTNSYGVNVEAATGATNNYAARLKGQVLVTGGLVDSGTTFTASGCSVTTLVGGSTTGSFVSGTTGTCTVVITVGAGTNAAPNGWKCSADNQTTANTVRQSASSTTSCTVTGTTVSGDVISFGMRGY